MSPLPMVITTEHALASGVDESHPLYWVAAYVQSAKTPRTRQARHADIQNVLDVMIFDGLEDIFAMNSEAIAHYRDCLILDGKAPSTVARRLCSLRGLFDYAIARGWMNGVNPATTKLTPPPAVPNTSETESLTVDEVHRLLGTCDTSIRGVRDRAFIIIALYHGLRVDEIVCLTAAKPDDWAQRTSGGYFTREGNHILLRIKGKGNKYREQAVKPTTFEVIETYLAATDRTFEDDGPLFEMMTRLDLVITGTAMTAAQATYMLERRCKLAGITKNITPHSLRHSIATKLIEDGVDVEELQKFLGHSDPKTTLRYVHRRRNLDENVAYRVSW